MAKMDTVLTGAGSFANELVGLVRDLRIGLRAQMERTFPGVTFTPGPAPASISTCARRFAWALSCA